MYVYLFRSEGLSIIDSIVIGWYEMFSFSWVDSRYGLGKIKIMCFSFFCLYKSHSFHIVWCIYWIFSKRSILSLDLFGIVFSNVIVSSVENRIFGWVELFTDAWFITYELESLKLLRAHSIVDVDCQSSQEKVFRGLADWWR